MLGLSDSELARQLEECAKRELWNPFQSYARQRMQEAARRLRSHEEDIKRAYQAGFDFANETRKEE